MTLPRLLLLPILLLLAGCIPSLSPLAGPEQRIADPALAGAYAGPEGEIMVLDGPAEDGSYRLVLVDRKDTAGVFRATLTEIAGRRYLDFVPVVPAAIAANEFLALHFSPWHSFVRIETTADGFALHLPDLDWLSAHLAETPAALAHAIDGGLRITAGTAELRAFVAAEERLFDPEPRAYSRL